MTSMHPGRMTGLIVRRGTGFLLVGVSIMFSVVSCTDDSPPAISTETLSSSGNRPPVITSAKFLHSPLSLDAPIAVQIHAEDPEREAVSYRYQWYVNGASVNGQTNATLPPELLRRGQKVFVEIVPSDGTQKGEAFRTEAVIVGNTPPHIDSVTLVPPAAQAGVTLRAQVEAGDPDHDRVDLAYRWLKNKVVVKEGEDSFLDTTGFKSRDHIDVEVTARDSEAVGNSLRSGMVLVNSAPKILSTPPAADTPDRYEYSVKAVDLDADRLVYQLEVAPPGMMIDEQSGHITWQIPSGQHGTFHVRVIARDGQGGEAYQEFDLTLADSLSPKPPQV